MRIYSPTSVLGYGYAPETIARAREFAPDVIAVDGGSTDPGPYYLGSGTGFTDPALVKRDLEPVLELAVELGVPLLIGTAGSAGGDPHVAQTVRIIREIADAQSLGFRLASISSELDAGEVVGHLDAGRTRPLDGVAPLDVETVRRARRIVALMGVEPYQAAMKAGAQVVVAGRSDDAAIFAARGIAEGIDPASCWVAGKFLECGDTCAAPGKKEYGSSNGLFATVTGDSVLLEPAHSKVRCTEQSVASFLLHENASPVRHTEPSGVLDLAGLSLEQVDDRRVRVSGARFEPAELHSVRLEGVELAGSRTIVIGWTRDPTLVEHIDSYLADCHAQLRERLEVLEDEPGRYGLQFRVIGKNAVMGAREPVQQITAHELGIIAEALAPTQEEAASIAAAARQTIKNGEYPGKLCDEGCITFPYSPSEAALGEVYRFSVWHALAPADPDQLFTPVYEDVGGPA